MNVIILRGFAIIGILLGISLSVQNCGGNPDAAGNDPRSRMMAMRGGMGIGEAVPVRIEKVRRDTIADYILKTTTLEPKRRVEILAKTTGFAEELNVEEGMKVRKNQILVQLDDRQERIALQEATVRRDNSKLALERSQKMLDDNLISQEAFEKIKYDDEQAKAQYERAALDLEYTKIRTPFNGTIISRSVEVGDMVRQNVAIFEIADFRTLLARIYVPEKDIRKISLKQAAMITTDVYPGKEFYGSVWLINPTVDSESGTVKVTIEIKHDLNLLQPGMFCSVKIITDFHPNSIVIPKKALVLESEEDMVFTYNNGVAKRRLVKVGLKDNLNLEILSGLRPDEEIITVGHEGIRDGVPVRDISRENEDGDFASAETSVPPARTESGEPRVRGERGSEGDGPRMGGRIDISNVPDDKIDDILDIIFTRRPELKKEYDEQAKKDPDLKTNPDKKREFIMSMRKQAQGSSEK